MRTSQDQSNRLFGWENIEIMPDILRMQLVLDNLLDENIICKLESKRANGRNDYPVLPMWRLIICLLLSGHRTVSSFLRELNRNRDLAALCGFDPYGKLPDSCNVTRFMHRLEEVMDSIENMRDSLVEKVSTLIPDFGRFMALDSKAIPSFANQASDKLKKDGTPDRWGEHDAAISEKTHFVEKADGTKEEVAYIYYGFKVHLLIDIPTQLPIYCRITQGLVADGPMALPILESIHSKHPELLKGCETLAADRAYDDEDSIKVAHDRYHVNLLIPTRKLWKKDDFVTIDSEGKKTILKQLPGEGCEELVYDQDGQIYCFHKDASSGVEGYYPMTFKGYEKDRKSLKYVCPAKAKGFTCGRCEECPYANGQIRVKTETNRRIFIPTPRHTLSFKRAYNGRTAVERTNGVLDTVFGFEWHTMRGLATVNLRVNLALVCMLAMAVGRIKNGQEGLLRSLVRAA